VGRALWDRRIVQYLHHLCKPRKAKTPLPWPIGLIFSSMSPCSSHPSLLPAGWLDRLCDRRDFCFDGCVATNTDQCVNNYTRGAADCACKDLWTGSDCEYPVIHTFTFSQLLMSCGCPVRST